MKSQNKHRYDSAQQGTGSIQGNKKFEPEVSVASSNLTNVATDTAAKHHAAIQEGNAEDSAAPTNSYQNVKALDAQHSQGAREANKSGLSSFNSTHPLDLALHCFVRLMVTGARRALKQQDTASPESA